MSNPRADGHRTSAAPGDGSPPVPVRALDQMIAQMSPERSTSTSPARLRAPASPDAAHGHDDLPLQPLAGEPLLDVERLPGAVVGAVVLDGLAVGDGDSHDVTPRRTMTADGLSGAAS